MQFANVSITIDPGHYTGRYFLSSHGYTSFTGLRTVVLIPALFYVFGVGSYAETSTAASFFYFTLGADGQVTSTIKVGTGNPGKPSEAIVAHSAPCVTPPHGWD
jgi:hypothetical protein